MSKGMDTLHDLIEEAKKRTLVWVVCILGLSYCLSLTSNMVWLNIPISFLIISGIRYLSFEVELQRRSPAIPQPSYLYHLHRRQLSPDDPLLLPPLVTVQWKRNIDSPVVEAAVDEFTRKIVQEFVTDLWYSSITPDQEFPEQICLLINDVLGEISQRIKRVNLIDLLTRDMVDLIGSHLELYRRNQAHIGVDVMGILSSEERDERLKHCLASARELHPALISSEEEYKVLQRLMGGLVAVVLRPQDAECPLVRCLARELLACAVIQPVMSFASPGSINEIIEFVVLASKDTSKEEAQNKKLDKEELADVSHSKSAKEASGRSMFKDGLVSGSELMETGEGGLSSKDRNSSERDNYGARGPSSSYHDSYLDPQLKVLSALQSRPADWAQLLESIRQRRTQVLAPENLDNLWTKGRNYRQKDISKDHAKLRPSLKSSVLKQDTEGTVKQEGVRQMHEQPIQWEDAGNSTSMELLDATGGTKTNIEQMMFGSTNYLQDSGRKAIQDTDYSERDLQVRNQSFLEKEVSKSNECQNYQVRHKRSKSGGTVFEGWQKVDRSYFPEGGENWDSKKLWGSKSGEAQSFPDSDNPSVIVWPQTGIAPVPKLKCWVLGAHFEKVGSKSFAVYSIAVTNTENKTWFVDRRYRNFEQLHRRLRDIPNYALQLPPKRFLSSSLDDYFVQQRCILLDKYLKDLLSIPNIAEQHEVWDFLSATSKNYSFGKSPSVMKTLAVNVDDAVDDIVRQFKEVSDGLRRRVAGVSSSSEEIPTAPKDLHMKSSWTSEAAMTNESNWDSMDRFQSLSDVEEGVGDRWHSDSELQIQPFPSQPIVRPAGEPGNSDLEKLLPFERRVERLGSDGCSTIDSLTGSDIIEDEFGMPPEWSPPKLSVPLLNLVDNIFQLQQRGWLRRQVFWISKQILQLIMEDAIDDWLLRQIQWLRRDDIIALGIRWAQDVLWPNGVFISKGNTQRQIENAIINNPNGLTTTKENHGKILAPTSFEEQLEAARKASFVHDILFGGVPSALVSLIGGKQYRHCVNNIFFFLQSSVCVKQLAYSLLELLLITVFPELRELVLDIHGKTSLNSKCFVLPS